MDIRFINDEDMEDINHMKIVKIHFAWDNPKDDLEEKFRWFAKNYRYAHKGMVYVLTNFNSTMEENLMRIKILAGLGFDPFVMVYNRPSASQEILDLQRWCNNKFVFRKTPSFAEYQRGKTACDVIDEREGKQMSIFDI